MKPGDLVFFEDALFGRHRFWRIESVLLGALAHESLVRIVSLSESAGSDEAGISQRTTLVPEVLIRGKIYSSHQKEPVS